MRIRSGNANLSDSTPTKVNDMKDGEWRLTEGGLYARVGDQILTKGFGAWAQNLAGITDEFDDESIDPKWGFSDPSSLQFDEFDDGEIASFWYTYASHGPPTGEQDGYIYRDYIAPGNMHLAQKANSSFDIWTKIDIGQYTLDLGNSLGCYFGWQEETYGDPNPGDWRGTVRLNIIWQSGSYYDTPVGERLFVGIYAELWGNGYSPYPTFDAYNTVAMPDTDGLAIDEIYLRHKWDAETNTTRFFWSLTLPVVDGDWTEFVWDAPQGTFDHIDTSFLPDGSIDDWDEMRGILRTINFSPSALVGYYFWCNNEYLPNTQKIFNFSEWSQPNNIPASHEEAADGTMTFIFGGGSEQDSVSCYQDPVGEVSEFIPPGALFSKRMRFYVPPYLYTADQTSNGDDVYHYTQFQWNLWDDQIEWTFALAWMYGGMPAGYDMFGFESCYGINIDVSDEYNSTSVVYASSALEVAGRADYVNPVPVDETHNGWFTFRFTRNPAGEFKFEVQPDGSETWYDVTPPGLTDYDLNIGGKGSYEWGFDIYGREYAGISYVGGTQGPIKVDWLRL